MDSGTASATAAMASVDNHDRPVRGKASRTLQGRPEGSASSRRGKERSATASRDRFPTRPLGSSHGPSSPRSWEVPGRAVGDSHPSGPVPEHRESVERATRRAGGGAHASPSIPSINGEESDQASRDGPLPSPASTAPRGDGAGPDPSAGSGRCLVHPTGSDPRISPLGEIDRGDHRRPPVESAATPCVACVCS